jgi:hypothetical protein
MANDPKAVHLGGIDLGQVTDPSALAIVEKVGAGEAAVYTVLELTRFRLGTSYPDIVTETLGLMVRIPQEHLAPLVVDQTGVGRAVVDMFVEKARGRYICPVTITNGQRATQQPDTRDWHVPKKDLVGVVNRLLQTNRLLVAPDLQHARLLNKELSNFRYKITAAANVVYEAWREGQHDDLVLAVALAVWLGNQGYGDAGTGAFIEGRREFDIADTLKRFPSPFPGKPWD